MLLAGETGHAKARGGKVCGLGERESFAVARAGHADCGQIQWEMSQKSSSACYGANLTIDLGVSSAQCAMGGWFGAL